MQYANHFSRESFWGREGASAGVLGLFGEWVGLLVWGGKASTGGGSAGQRGRRIRSLLSFRVSALPPLRDALLCSSLCSLEPAAPCVVSGVVLGRSWDHGGLQKVPHSEGRVHRVLPSLLPPTCLPPQKNTPALRSAGPQNWTLSSPAACGVHTSLYVGLRIADVNTPSRRPLPLSLLPPTNCSFDSKRTSAPLLPNPCPRRCPSRPRTFLSRPHLPLLPS